MLNDLSASIKALLEYELKTPGEEVVPDLSISFDQPDEEFPPASITKPAVNLFMYDVREDLKLRHNERFFYKLNSPTSTTVIRNPLLVECSYLVTAWSDSEVAGAHDEHYVLSTIVKALRRYNCLPDTLPNKIDPDGEPVQILQGSLQEVVPFPRAFTIQDGYLQTLGEFWRSMGHEPKPRFNYTVTIAVDAFEPSERSVIDTVELSLAESAAPEAESDEATLQLLLPDDDARLLAGTEFLLATNIDGDQRGPAVAAITGGGFIAAWRSSSSLIGEEPADLPGIAGQLYDASGNLVGAEFLANTFTVNDQRDVEVAGLRDGGFVMVWKTSDPATGDTGNGIAGRRYDANGNAVTNEFLVNTVTLGDQEEPIVAGLADGGFVVMWESDTATDDGSGFGIVGQRYGSDSIAVGEEFLVNTFTSGNQRSVDVASLTDGGFIAVWESNDPGIGDTDGIVAQRYDANGALVNSEFLVNTVTTSSQFGAKVAGLSNGGFVVIWDSDSALGDSSAQGVVGQLYSADSTAVGSEFLVNTFTGNSQSNADVASLADGGFVVAWETMDVATGDTDGIAARRYDVNGNALGSEFLVNTFTTDGQQIPEVTGLADGGIVVVWRTFDVGTGDDNGVAARQYAFADTLIVDVLANDSDADPNGTLTLDSVTVTGELGQAWIAFNKLVFYAGTDFDYLDEGESTSVTVCYTMSDASGFSSDASVDITVVGRKHVYQAQLYNSDILGVNVLVRDEFLVNTNTENNQGYPEITALNNGGFIVVWESGDESSGDTDPLSVAGRRYGSDGNPLADEFLINTHTVGNQREPNIAALADDSFIVVWKDNDTTEGDTSSTGISGRLYDSNGIALDDEFLVNTYTLNSQDRVNVTSLTGSSFVVAWESSDPSTGDSTSDGISAKIYYANGTVQKDEFLVNTHTAGGQDQANVERLLDGGFVMTWRSAAQETGDLQPTGIAGQRFDAEGTPIGSEFLVNTNTLNDQRQPYAKTLFDGSFVVAWRTFDSTTGDTSSDGIAAQRFSAEAVPLGTEFLVNTNTINGQEQPQVAALADGGFLIVWQSDALATGDSSGDGVYGQRYEANGTPVGGEFLVNTNTSGNQYRSAVTGLVDGGFVVTWDSNDVATGDSEPSSVAARQYQFSETFIIDVLARKAGIYNSSDFTLDSVEALAAGNGTVSIVNNKLVFVTGSDFDDLLLLGDSREVDINYTWSGNLGQSVNSSVTVKVVNQRPFSPSVLSPVFWLDADDDSTIIKDGANLVSQWSDKSGNGNHATQGTSSDQPTHTANTLNGLSAMVFDGTNDHFDFAGNFITDTSYSVFIVEQRLSGANMAPISGGNTQNNQLDMLYLSDSILRIAHGSAGGIDSSVPAYTTPFTRVISHTHDETNGNHTYINGTNTGSNTGSTPDMSPTYGGRIGTRSNSIFYDGNIGEVIMYDRELSTHERKALEQYLADKWGVTLS